MYSLVTSGDLSLDTFFFTQCVHEITEGRAREDIWSSVNYVLFYVDLQKEPID